MFARNFFGTTDVALCYKTNSDCPPGKNISWPRAASLQSEAQSNMRDLNTAAVQRPRRAQSSEG
jgi:hypothetical protein